jgi:threonine/homoserine/homoserine lactone efflux protein
MIIALAGGALLLFIGFSYLRGVYKGSIHLPKPDVDTEQRSPTSMILLGMGTTISNPFWYTWWVTVAAGYLAQARELGFLAVAVFFIGHISADFAWDSTLSISTSAGSKLLNNRSYRGLILITGIFMLYLGVSFLVSARNFI